MSTSNPTASRTRFGGTPTIASNNLSLNTGYLAQSKPFEAQGINTLTEHMLINVGTFVDATGWANMIDSFYRTLQVNTNRVPTYSSAQLSAYVSMAMNVQIAFAELRRDLAIGSLVDAYSMSFLRDIYGTQYATLYSSFVTKRAQNVADFNYLLENTRNTYPVPATSYVNMARYLLGNIFRDDTTRRGQYVLPHTVYALSNFTFDDATIPLLGTFEQRLNSIKDVINAYLSTVINGTANAKVAANIAADITKVYGAYAYWNMQLATTSDVLVPICDTVLLNALNFDVNGTWDVQALKAAVSGTSLSGDATIGIFATETYPRYAAFIGVAGTDLALTNAAKIDHVVITARSDSIPAETLADLMTFASVPQIVKQTIGWGENQRERSIACATSASGITPSIVWFNTTTTSTTDGSFSVSSAVTHIQKFLSATASSISLTDLDAIVPAMWTNALTPVVMQMTATGEISRRLIFAEVDEVTNVEYNSLTNMLTTLAQRYDDMFTLFMTKEVAPKINLKQGAAAVGVEVADKK